MHELSIATQLMDQVLRVAGENDAGRVVEVEVHCGVMQQVVPEALEMAFEAVAAGTVAEGSRLVIVEDAMRARCRVCGHEYEPNIDDFLCPKCSQANAELLVGQDIVLQTVICETEDRAKL